MPDAAINNLKKSYYFRQAYFLLLAKIFLLEVFFSIVFYLTGLFLGRNQGAVYTYIFLGISLLNAVLIMVLLLRWNAHVFIISEDAIAIRKGFFFRRNTTFDIHSIQSIKVRQGIFGNIFNFGTLEFESGLNPNPVIPLIQSPYEHAEIIEKQHIKSVGEKPLESIAPIVSQ